VDNFFVVRNLPVIEELRLFWRYVELLFDTLGIYGLKLLEGYSFSILFDGLLKVLRVADNFFLGGLHAIA
jgi:hypothetical protein